MCFQVVKGKLNVNFLYPEDVDLTLDPLDFRDHILQRYFGKATVEYPRDFLATP